MTFCSFRNRPIRQLPSRPQTAFRQNIYLMSFFVWVE